MNIVDRNVVKDCIPPKLQNGPLQILCQTLKAVCVATGKRITGKNKATTAGPNPRTFDLPDKCAVPLEERRMLHDKYVSLCSWHTVRK